MSDNWAGPEFTKMHKFIRRIISGRRWCAHSPLGTEMLLASAWKQLWWHSGCRHGVRYHSRQTDRQWRKPSSCTCWDLLNFISRRVTPQMQMLAISSDVRRMITRLETTYKES